MVVFVFAFFLIGEDINWFKKIEESNIEAEAGQDAGRLFNIYADYLFFENMSESCIFLNIEGFSITLMFVRELPGLCVSRKEEVWELYNGIYKTPMFR